MLSKQPVLVIGAGIAGPAVGVALRRAGIDSVVHEASPTPRDSAGAFLNLAPNGLAVLRSLGLAHALDGVGFLNDRLVFHNEAGRVLADAPVGGVTVPRGALSRALREAAEQAGVRFEFGKALRSIEEHGDAVTVRFADRTVATGCCALGADGIHSRTRYGFFPEAPKPAYTGIINLGGVVRTDLPSTGTAMHMIFGRRAFFGYAVRPSGDTFWFSNVPHADEPSARARESAASAGIGPPELLALHRDDPPEVRRILERLDGEIGAYAVYDIMSLPRWHRGRVCLIGDAAHAVGPHVGQGASLALEDALVVAKCLRDVPEVPRAFSAFEALRRSRAERVLEASRRTARQKAPTSWLGRKFRDLLLPAFLRQGAASAQWLYSSAPIWDDTRGASAGNRPASGSMQST